MNDLYLALTAAPAFAPEPEADAANIEAAIVAFLLEEQETELAGRGIGVIFDEQQAIVTAHELNRNPIDSWHYLIEQVTEDGYAIAIFDSVGNRIGYA